MSQEYHERVHEGRNGASVLIVVLIIDLLTDTVAQLPAGDDTVCEADESFQIFPGVNIPQVMAQLSNIGF